MKLAPAAARGFLAAPDRDTRGALLYGPNRAAAREAAQKLIAWAVGPAADDLSLTTLTEDDLRKDKTRLVEEVQVQSLLGGARAVRVRLEGDSAADALVRVVKHLDEGGPAAAWLIVEAGDLPARSRTRAAFEGAKRLAALPFYEDSADDLARLADSALKAAGLKLDPDARALLQRRLPSDRGLLTAELEKLTVFAHGDASALDAATLDALLPDDPEAAVDEAAQAALSGKGAEAAAGLSDLSSVSGVSALKALERKLLRLVQARRLMEGGLSAQAAVKALKPPVFWKEADAFTAQLRVWSPKALAQALDLVWRAQLRAMQAGAPQELIAAAAFRAIAGIAARS